MTTYYEMPFKTLKTVQFLITINIIAEFGNLKSPKSSYIRTVYMRNTSEFKTV